MKKNNIEKIAASPAVLVELTVQETTITQIKLKLAKYFSYQIIGQPKDLLQKQITQWLISYSQRKEEKWQLPCERTRQTEFQKTVLGTLISIGFGKVTNYKKLAELSGYPNAQRAVGTACSQNCFPLIVPCHRVVRLNGLGGFATSIEIKKRLLEFETGQTFKIDSPKSSS